MARFRLVMTLDGRVFSNDEALSEAEANARLAEMRAKMAAIGRTGPEAWSVERVSD